MGKRSSFERRQGDFYPTPAKAVAPLVPHLRGIRDDFAEPCDGDGALVASLESHGLCCVYRGDLATGQDALAVDDYGKVPVITNPPYDTKNGRKLMNALILHFMRATPFVWLLIDYDWSATKRAAPYLRNCTDIVMLPRLKWIADSEHTGKDNHAWFRFDISHTAGPVLHACGAVPTSPHAAVCRQCGTSYRPQRSTSRFCSDSCCQRAHRGRRLA